jgi:hypothetical protein
VRVGWNAAWGKGEPNPRVPSGGNLADRTRVWQSSTV